MRLADDKDYRHAIEQFGDYLRDIVAAYPAADILELGGGRHPSFTLADMPSSVNSYTVNDVSQSELALTSDEYRKACFDVTGDTSEFEGRYDVVFSRFLAEHVADGRAMHKNVYSVLKPGGVAFHLIPTLYSSPFVANILLPEDLARELLIKLRPHRKSISPKFRAYYSFCYGGGAKMIKLFEEIGYSKLEIRKFYGHGYYDKIPILREIEQFASTIASRHENIPYSSFAYVTAYK
jgi:SAM-dependent methyltransferase